MAKKSIPTGIVPRESSIKIWFMYQGKRVWESLPLSPTPANIKHAARVRDEIINRIAIGAFEYHEFFPESKRATKSATPTFQEMAERWLLSKSQQAQSTLYGYRKMLRNHVYPAIGNKPIDKITYSRLAVLLAGLDVSAKTRNNIATVIRQPFLLAVRDGLIKDNPAQHLENAKAQKVSPDPFTVSEMEAILENLDSDWKNYFEFAFFTGLRTSELAAVTWQDVDFRRQTVRIDKAFVLGEVKDTKTHSARDVELNSRALAALKRQEMKTGLKNGVIFTNPKTKQRIENDKTAYRPWALAIKKAGIRHRKPYNTRHTFATLNLMAGANPMWVARQLGHTTMKMLLENYSRWIDSADKQREKSKLEDFLNCANDVPKNQKNTANI
ncbi:tyrosine-type recombinase/integrase [Neisseria weixii]|uniref:tyrosine-type recombinase/integrase n=1 Tax=Neisseria weixii TaxID=1853276 RepID=UPI00359F6630